MNSTESKFTLVVDQNTVRYFPTDNAILFQFTAKVTCDDLVKEKEETIRMYTSQKVGEVYRITSKSNSTMPIPQSEWEFVKTLKNNEGRGKKANKGEAEKIVGLFMGKIDEYEQAYRSLLKSRVK